MKKADVIKRLEPYIFKPDFTEQDTYKAMDVLLDGLNSGAITSKEARKIVRKYPVLDIHPSPVDVWENGKENNPEGIC